MTDHADGTRRLYAVDGAPLREVDRWLEQYRRFWDQHLDALSTELARGKRNTTTRNTTRTSRTAKKSIPAKTRRRTP